MGWGWRKSGSAFALVLVMAFLASCTKVGPSIYKKWIMGTDEEQFLVDLLDHVHYTKARTYSEEICQLVRGSYTPGVFYLLDQQKCTVRMEGPDAGAVCCHHNGRDTVVCTFKHLTDDSVTFVFPGKGEMKATATQRNIKVVNTNSEEINVDDLVDVYDNYLRNPHILENICKPQGLSLITRKKAATREDYSHEIWGRGVGWKAWLFCSKTSDNALALGYLYKGTKGSTNPDYSEAAISFSNPKLINIYEQQMSLLGYFRQDSIPPEGPYEIVFAPRTWDETSDAPVFTLVDDKSGIYYLSFGE